MSCHMTRENHVSALYRFYRERSQIVTLVLLIGSATLGLVMTVYLVSLATRRRYAVACGALALVFFQLSILAALLGIHLVYDVPVLIQIRALLALLTIPCFYLYFAAAASASYRLSPRHLIHAIPCVTGMAVVASGYPWLLDFVLFASYSVYLLALLALWAKRAVHFSELGKSARQTVIWLQIIIVFFAATLILEVFILVDLSNGGFLTSSTPLLFSILSLTALISFSLIGALGRPSLFEHLYNLTVATDFASAPRNNPVPDAAQKALAGKALQLLKNPVILADDALTVTRLARKLGVPARQLSHAINRVCKCSFSDVLNDHRVQLCEKIMRDNPDETLMDVMLSAGYVTKSSFYRQFSERTGLTPAAYRAKIIEDA